MALTTAQRALLARLPKPEPDPAVVDVEFLAGVQLAPSPATVEDVDLLPPFVPVVDSATHWGRHLLKAAEDGVRIVSVDQPWADRWQFRIAGAPHLDPETGETSVRAYWVRVRPVEAVGGQWEASCNCPAGKNAVHNCKHKAVALSALAEGKVLVGEANPFDASRQLIAAEAEKAIAANGGAAEAANYYRKPEDRR